MRYQNVYIESIAYTLPEEVATSEQIETRLGPLYERLRLPQGRLELMSGIKQRRFWPLEMLPGDQSVKTAEKAIDLSGIDKNQIGGLIHGSVCRDYLEPATACAVHHRLGLGPSCMIYDVSNACLGLLNGAIQLANMIEIGQICSGIVVGTESSRSLMETTIESLNSDISLSRQDIKSAFASLTIGSGSAAIVLCDRQLSKTGNRLLGGVAKTNTDFCDLCRSGRDETASDGMKPIMATDCEALMQKGIEVAGLAFSDFLAELDWAADSIDKTFCHQVGKAHHKLLF